MKVDPAKQEIVGYNPDRMDAHLSNVKLPNFKGYFVARFPTSRSCNRASTSGVLPVDGQNEVTGEEVGGFARFNAKVVEVQVGTSFISIEQARANLDAEMPEWQFEATRERP